MPGGIDCKNIRRWLGAERAGAWVASPSAPMQNARPIGRGVWRCRLWNDKGPVKLTGPLRYGCLTMTYFRTGTPYYHRRATVSRSCSRWEGVVPAGYGRQALTGCPDVRVTARYL